MILRKVAASMAIVLASAFVLLAARAQTPAWKQLFNGKDLTGWKHVGPGEMTVEDGYEVQIDNHPEASNEDEYHVTAALYSLTKPLAKPGKPGPEWNTMEITLDGPHTMVMLNDVKVTDYTEGQPVPERKFDFEPQRGRRPDEGYIGLQNHSDKDIVFFKEVSVQSLK